MTLRTTIKLQWLTGKTRILRKTRNHLPPVFPTLKRLEYPIIGETQILFGHRLKESLANAQVVCNKRKLEVLRTQVATKFRRLVRLTNPEEL